MKNNWFEETRSGHSFTKTEDYLFAFGTSDEKRIGDMSRDELIVVIAAGYYERELLARAIRELTANQQPEGSADLARAIKLSRLIIEKSEAVN